MSFINVMAKTATNGKPSEKGSFSCWIYIFMLTEFLEERFFKFKDLQFDCFRIMSFFLIFWNRVFYFLYLSSLYFNIYFEIFQNYNFKRAFFFIFYFMIHINVSFQSNFSNYGYKKAISFSARFWNSFFLIYEFSVLYFKFILSYSILRVVY